MAFTALHAQWGTVCADLPDLGCGREWAAVWKTGAPLRCPECAHPMHAKHQQIPRELKFFAHAPGAPTCTLAVESAAHHLLKLALATAARDAGAHAALEVTGAGAWRADVLASDPGGAWQIALEAQLAPIAPGEITARTERMPADDVRSCWFSDHPRPPWLGLAPSARLASTDTGLTVAEGLAKFNYTAWLPAPAIALPEFLAWMFTGRIRLHRPTTPADSLPRPLDLLWTAPVYIEAEQRYLADAQYRVEPAAGASVSILRPGAKDADLRRFMSRMIGPVYRPR